jgi:hypothetical protein
MNGARITQRQTPRSKTKGHLASAAGKMEGKMGSRPMKWSGGVPQSKVLTLYQVYTKLKAHSWCNCAKDFLHKMGVPDVTSAACACWRAKNTGACNYLLPPTSRHKGAAQGKRTLGLRYTGHGSGGGKKGHKMVTEEKDPRAVPARGWTYRTTGLSIKLAL